MPIVVVGVVLALGIFGLSFLGKKKRTRVVVAGGPAGVPSVFESESQARSYFLAHAARIARTGNLEAIDLAMQAMRELGVAEGPEYDLLAAAAAGRAPLLDPFA